MVQEVGRDRDVVVLNRPVQSRPASCAQERLPISSTSPGLPEIARRGAVRRKRLTHLDLLR